jgi:WD40 repeat protein
MGTRCRRAVAFAILGVASVLAPVAAASTIVYSKGTDVWLMNPDGTGQHQVTHGAILSIPSQADDGTILALTADGHVVRMDQYGNQLSPPTATVVTGGATTFCTTTCINVHGPFDPVLSPDGTTFSYWGTADMYTYNSACSCTEFETKSFVRYGDPTHFAEPSSQQIGQEDYAYPSYIDKQTLLMSQVGNDGLIPLVAVYTLGTGGDNSTLWFSDPAANSEGMKEGVMDRQKDKLAFVVGVNDAMMHPAEQLRMYTTNGPPAAMSNAPTPQCAYNGPSGGAFNYPSFSPDGQYLAWQEGDGIHVGFVGAGTDCTKLTDKLVAPGGSHPAWGPADLKPPPVKLPPVVHCIVPNVKGKTLTAAGTALRAAHCKLGSVMRPAHKPKRKPGRHKRWALLVTGESPRALTVTAKNAAVALTLGYRAVHK